MIKAIIFDYGGVIGSDPGDDIYKKVSRKFGVRIGEIKANFSAFIFLLQKNKINEKDFWKKFSRKLNINDYKLLRKTWLGEYQRRARANRDLLNFIVRLKKRYRVYLLSNRAVFYKKRSLDKRLKIIFSGIIYSCDVGMRKPEKNIYRYLLKKFQLKPAECIIVDDNDKYLLYPQKLGMQVIHFRSLYQLDAKLKNLLNIL